MFTNRLIRRAHFRQFIKFIICPWNVPFSWIRKSDDKTRALSYFWVGLLFLYIDIQFRKRNLVLWEVAAVLEATKLEKIIKTLRAKTLKPL